LVAALESECPEDYFSYIPIHQDGSCNGLQHYAALGRDKEGGASVNLCSFDTPQDVYSCIVDLVEERRKEDAENGLMIAKELEGFISRKIIKANNNDYHLDDFSEELQHMASMYLTNQTFKSLSSLFTATKEIQDWLVKLAEGVSKNCLQNVEWETPLGFPIVQPYSKVKPSFFVHGQICREEFVKLHSQPILENLAKFMINKYSSYSNYYTCYTSKNGVEIFSLHDILHKVPKKGDLDINEVLRSVFFFS
ncbi:DNA-directed RNA polymerase 2A, partial [Armadillidium nasatum]